MQGAEETETSRNLSAPHKPQCHACANQKVPVLQVPGAGAAIYLALGSCPQGVSRDSLGEGAAPQQNVKFRP